MEVPVKFTGTGPSTSDEERVLLHYCKAKLPFKRLDFDRPPLKYARNGGGIAVPVTPRRQTSVEGEHTNQPR